MKLLGHVYVATKAFPEKDEKLLAIGAVLPEIVFYIKNPVFTYEQLHEGGIYLYKCLSQKDKKLADIALGVLTHSKKYGADGFNSLDHIKEIGYKEKDDEKISDALGIPIKFAYQRAHSLYSLAIDYYLYKNYPNLIIQIKELKNFDQRILTNALEKCYQVEKNDIFNNLQQLWNLYDLKLVGTFEGIASLWKRLAQNFVEKETMNIERTAELIEEFYKKAKPNIPKFLEKVVKETRSNVISAIDK